MARVPLIGMQLQRDQFGVRAVGQAVSYQRTRRWIRWRLILARVSELIDAPVFAMHTVCIIFVALAGIGPIKDIHAAVRAVVEIDASKPRVTEFNKVLTVPGHVAGAAALE